MEQNILVIEENKEKEIELEKENISILSEEVIVDYNQATNKPKINNIELLNNKSFQDLGIIEITNTELNELFKEI